MQGFDYRLCSAYHYFEHRQWATLKTTELVSIGHAVGDVAAVQMDREARRRKPVLFKWPQEHWEQFQPILENLHTRFEGDPE
jgi:hypothetical protein